MFGHTDALFDHIGAELLHRQGANIAEELANYCIAESVIVKVQDVLNNLLIISHTNVR